jgi:hypothetical protein
VTQAGNLHRTTSKGHLLEEPLRPQSTLSLTSRMKLEK